MNKKGFTLVELLAIIIVLGLITTIIVPTVNNIVDNSRKEALMTSARDILKVTKDYVDVEKITGNKIYNEKFNFEDDTKLDINNKPDNGYIEVIDGSKYALAFSDDGYCVYKNGSEEDIKVKELEDGDVCTASSDRIASNLKSYTETSTADFRNSAYLSKIINVVFEYKKREPGNIVKSMDLSSANDGSIMGYLIPNATYYDLYVDSNNDIYAPANLSYFFTNMTSLKNIVFNNFNTSNVTNMSYAFSNIAVENIDFTSLDTSNVTNMSSMFQSSKSFVDLDLRKLNTSKVTNMELMFANCSGLKTINFTNFNTSNVTSMFSMFQGTWNIKTLDLTSFDTSNVTNMANMFQYTYAMDNIYVSNKFKIPANSDEMYSSCLAGSVTVK